MPTGVFVRLDRHALVALRDAATRELRRPQDQAALFVREALVSAGWLSIDGEAMPPAAPSRADESLAECGRSCP